MLTATIYSIINLILLAVICTALIYLFVLLAKALKKYIMAKPAEDERQRVCQTLGETIKANRIRCKMTQEFVAESLGVSR